MPNAKEIKNMYLAYLLFGIFLGVMFTRIYELYKYVCNKYANITDNYSETISDSDNTISKVA